jgi:hypothetical protein
VIVGATAGILASGLTTISGGIHNEGTIEATGGGSNDFGIGIVNSSSVSDGITNSGLISGYDGIHVAGASTVSGGILNSGNISFTGNGGFVVTGQSVIENGINNAGGTISGGNYGIVLDSSSVTGGITNSGKINGLLNGLYLSNGYISGGVLNAVGGTISGEAGMLVSGSRIDGIINDGTISGSA